MVDHYVTEMERELGEVLNKYSEEQASGTPDYILARYLVRCLNVFNETMGERSEWLETADPKQDCAPDEPAPATIPVKILRHGTWEEVGTGVVGDDGTVTITISDDAPKGFMESFNCHFGGMSIAHEPVPRRTEIHVTEPQRTDPRFMAYLPEHFQPRHH